MIRHKIGNCSLVMYVEVRALELKLARDKRRELEVGRSGVQRPLVITKVGTKRPVCEPQDHVFHMFA